MALLRADQAGLHCGHWQTDYWGLPDALLPAEQAGLHCGVANIPGANSVDDSFSGPIRPGSIGAPSSALTPTEPP